MRATELLVALVGVFVATGACGGSGAGGTAGASGGSAGRADAGGTTGAAGSAGTGGGAIGEPPCPSRAVLGNLCSVLDPALCYTRCGPEGAGDRAATCDSTAGVYVDAMECVYNPAFDWSPYKIPAAGNAACGAGVTPRAFATCDVDTGVVCNSQAGVAGGTYIDTSGATMVGFCVCVVITTIGDTKGWSCAPAVDWPCPRGRGC